MYVHFYRIFSLVSSLVPLPLRKVCVCLCQKKDRITFGIIAWKINSK